VGEIAGEDDEVGLLDKPVHGRHRLFERMRGVGIGRAAEAPMGVGELHEMEVAGGLRRGTVGREKVRGECDACYAGKLEEIATIGFQHEGLPRFHYWNLRELPRGAGVLFPPIAGAIKIDGRAVLMSDGQHAR
jgi:hypothetical protein